MTNEELALMVQKGTEKQKCLEKLYCQNYKLIEKICRKYDGYEDINDLIQESYFGIVRAAELWDPTKEASFITYAVYWIKQAVYRYIEDCGAVMRIPSHRRAQMGRYHKVMNSYRVRFGCDPSDRELCVLLDVKPDQLEELKRVIQVARIRSTSEVIGGEDDDLTLEDTLPAEGDQYEDVLDRMQHEELSACVWSCIDGLEDTRAAQVSRKRYGEGKTFKECGSDLGISTERARQIEEKALRELRKPKHTKRLRPFLTEHGAYSMGLSHNGLNAFRRSGSSQEVAMMKLERLAGMSLWHGKEIEIESSE